MMKTQHSILALFFSLFCFLSFTGTVWAQDPAESANTEVQATEVLPTHVEMVSVETASEDLHPNLQLEKIWESGFDMQFNIGASAMDLQSHDLFGFDLGIKLGYRWKYGGIYFNFNDDLVFNDERGFGNNFTIDLRGIFYVPLKDNMELALGVGFGISQFTMAIPLSAGLNWHFDHLTLGFEINYLPAMHFVECGSGISFIHDLKLHFVLGYTY